MNAQTSLFDNPLRDWMIFYGFSCSPSPQEWSMGSLALVIVMRDT